MARRRTLDTGFLEEETVCHALPFFRGRLCSGYGSTLEPGFFEWEKGPDVLEASYPEVCS